MTVKIENMGTDGWRIFVQVLKAGAALDTNGNRPRGANGVNAFPVQAPDGGKGTRGSRLDDRWTGMIGNADRIIYFYSTPIAWTIVGRGGWVVPSDTYTPTTSGAQNRIREALESLGVAYLSDVQ